MADLSSRDLQEVLDKLVDLFGSRTETAREAIAETEVLTEGERLLRQREQRERKEAAEEIKKARQAERDAIWNSLSETEKQIERQKELDAEANRLTQQQIQKDSEQLKTFERRAKYELESLGFVKDSQEKLHQLANEREAIEKKLIEDLQKGLDESPDLQKKYGADAKNAKLAMEQERLYKQQLASMGRYVDSNNKLIDTTVKLTKEQEASLRKIKQETEARDESIQAVEKFKDMLGMKGAMAAGGFALTTAFEFLKAGIVGTYKGLIAYEDALLDGVRGQSVEAAMISEQQNAYAEALENTGSSLVSFGGQLIVQAAQMALTNIPMALLAAAIAGLLAVLGYASQAEAAIIKRDAELNKKRAALEDEAYKNFLELGEASVTGARGVTGLIDDLKSVGLTIKEFEKLNKILASNTREIAMFGSTTMAGAKSFIEVTGGLINSEMSKTFEKMGISQNSQMEHAQKYMAMQARFGLLEGKSKQDLIKGTQNYINELDKTAALTGASRKEQETARDFAMAQAELRAAIFDEKEKAKGGDEQAAIRVKELQGQMELVSKLKLIGQDQLGIGVARNAAAGQIVDPSSAKAVRMLAGSIEAYKTGAGTEQTRVGALGEELKAGFKELAPLARIKADAITGLADIDIAKLDDGITAFTNVAKLRAEFEKDPKNKGKVFDDKALDEMLSRVAKDARTQADVDISRKTQQEAIAKQDALLTGQLGAGKQMLEAAGMFGKAGKTMLDAGKYMWNAAFGGDKGDAENLAKDIMVKDEAISQASERVEIAKKKLEKKNLNEKDKKEAEEELKVWSDQVAMLKKQREQMVQEKKIHEDIAAIQGQRNVKQEEIAKATALRKETLLLKHNQELKEEMSKYDAEVAAGKRTNDINARRGKELTLNKKFQDELKKFENETNAQYRTVASSDEIKGKIAKLNNELKELKLKGVASTPSDPATPQSTDSKAYARTQRQGGTGASTATPPPASATSTTPGSSDTTSNAQLSSVLQFTSPSGTESNFKGLDQGMQDKLLAAATDYNATTGGKIQVNSAFRTPQDQQRLWDESVKLGTPGRGPEGFVVAKPGTSPHESGRAVDIQNWTDPKAVVAMNKQGLKQTVAGDYVHFQQAFDGGFFKAKPGGVHVNLAEGKNDEAVVPLNPGEKIRVEKPEQENNPPRKDPLSTVMATDTPSTSNQAAEILAALHDLMESKLDSMISAIRDGNNISDKILKYSQA